MDNKNEETPVVEPTQEELQAEQAATAEVKEEEVRTKVIENFGLNEDDNADLIGKLVETEIENHKKLSHAIGQKIKHRDALKTANEKKPDEPVTPPETTPAEEAGKDLDKRINEKFEDRELDLMPYPDELKTAIKRVAEIDKISIKKASEDPQIVPRIDAWKREAGADDASISKTHKTQPDGKTAYSKDSPPDVDMTTEEGRKEWETYKEWLSTQY